MCIAAAALASLRGRRHRIAAAALPKQGARGRVQSPTRRRRGSLALQPAGRSSSLPSQGLVAGGGVQLFVAGEGGGWSPAGGGHGRCVGELASQEAEAVA